MDTTLTAAGRVLSQKNASRIESLFLELGKILLDAKVMDREDLMALLAEPEPEEVEAASASSFIQKAKFCAWLRGCYEVFDLLEHNLHNIHINYKKGAIAPGLKQLLGDFSLVLNEMVDRMPDPVSDPFFPMLSQAAASFANDAKYHAWQSGLRSILSTCRPQFCDLCCSSDPDRLEQIRKTIADTCKLISEHFDSFPGNPWTEEVSAQSLQIEFPLELQGRGRPTKTNANKLPFTGVLFRIDEPSETPPSKGPVLPLYVPLEVAQAAVETVIQSQGLPLDVDSSLSKHANQEIAGIMVDAEIRGKDFVVKGHLFPWSQEEKVALIAANKDRLGMSMNANATGRKCSVNGRDVFWIESLELLGANILLSQKATYQKTRLLSAEGSTQVAIAANQKEPNMEIEEHLKDMTRTLQEIAIASQKDSERMQEQISALSSLVQSQQAVITEFQKERQDASIAAQARSEEEKKQQETAGIIAAVSEVVKAQMAEQKNQLLNLVNPSRSPRQIASRPVPLVAQSAVATPLTEEEIVAANLKERLKVANIQLQTMRETGADPTMRSRLIEEIRSMEAQLNGY